MLVGRIDLETPIEPNLEEVHTYRWITLADLQQELSAHPEHFTPWLAKALEFLPPFFLPLSLTLSSTSGGEGIIKWRRGTHLQMNH